MSLTVQPIFSRVTAKERELYNDFFKKTNPTNIHNYASGSSLTSLVDLADKVLGVIDRCNPICDTHIGSQMDQTKAIAARQWQLNHISEVKQRIAKAITYKQSYYDNHLLGIITKYILKCFRLWNNGFTTSIKTAEDFLLFWDSRVPLCKTNGTYTTRFFFPFIPVSWIQEHLDTRDFYNYTPSRTIQFTGTFGLKTVDDKTGNYREPTLPPGFGSV